MLQATEHDLDMISARLSPLTVVEGFLAGPYAGNYNIYHIVFK